VALEEICRVAAAHLPPYQLPKLLKAVESLPRNAMGKISKKALLLEMFPPEKVASQ
jgi:non-ribosomal peptide synthetase component E (peptide arylation enzyme)